MVTLRTIQFNAEQDTHGTHARSTGECSRNHCCREISVLHILSVCVALFTQHAMRMLRIILSSVACLVLSYFYMSSDNGTIFRKKNKLLQIKRVLIFSTIFILNVFHYKEEVCEIT